jgi:serine/threonine-protein kinase
MPSDRIAGQLQHPGVVPIYGLGELPDGRPYFQMKLVKGRTLAELLAARPVSPAASAPGDRPRFLKVFEQVCQAVAYGHSKGVIHRDLKPANVMVGAFGEVQVMDWGLAKVLQSPERERRDEAEPKATSVIDTLRAPGADGTQAGTVMGTPAYMAPEQARGEVETLDARADVFGLGAILCHILTGRPPFTGADAKQIARRAARGDVADAFARLDGCGAEAELVALAKRCLAAEPEERPADAGVLAKELTAYLESVEARLRRAELERAQAEVKAAEARKRHRVQLALAGAMLSLVALGGGGAWLWQQQRQAREAEAAERQQTDAAATSAMGQARLLLKQARKEPLEAGRFREAVAMAEKARELARTGGGSEEVEAEAAALAETLTQEAAAAARDRTLLAALLEAHGPHEGPRYRKDDKGLMLALAEPSADEQYRDAFRVWGLDVDATPTAEAAARLGARPAAVIVEVVAALDEWTSERRRQKRPKAECDRLMDLAQALDDDPGSTRRELRAMLARGHLERERALGMLSMALRPVPVPFDAGWGQDRGRLRRLAANTDVAKEPALRLLSLGRALRAAGEEGLALRLLQSTIRSRPREVVLHHELGILHWAQRRWREAAESYALVRALRPESGMVLAEALVKAGRVEEGIALFERLHIERPNNPWLHNAHAGGLCDLGKYKEAEAAYREAIRLKNDYPEAYYNLGVAMSDQGPHKEAEEFYRQALGIKNDFPAAHYNLGVALSNQGRHAEAESAVRQAIRLRYDYPNAHALLGTALSGQGRPKEAEAAYRQAIRLKQDDPGAHNNLGVALGRQGRLKEAEEAFRQAIRLEDGMREAHSNLGDALRRQRRYKEAEQAYRHALRLEQDNPKARYRLGMALTAQGRYKEAEQAYRHALRLEQDNPTAHYQLAYVLSAQGWHKEAEEACRQAIRLQHDYPEAHIGLGNTLGIQGRHKEAEGAFRGAIRLKHDSPEAHCNLGHSLREQGRFLDALESYRLGHNLGSKQLGWSSPSAVWVRECERLVELDRFLARIFRGEADPAGAAESLELTSLCQRTCKRLHATAARLAADAFAAQPKLAANLNSQTRYAAACSAALAAAGQAEDAKLLPDKVIHSLRRRALRWLRADLALYAQLAKRDNPMTKAAVRQRMEHWQQDPDLASVRDEAALARLPDDERADWRRLWDDVEALRKQVSRGE